MPRLPKIGQFCLLSGLLWMPFACQKKVETIQPIYGKITESVYASAIVKSKNQYQVFSAVGGLIQKIWVKEGDTVEVGDPLFTIDNESYQIQVANSKLAADYADFNTRGARLEELENAIQPARSKMLSDSLLLQRQRGLWAQQIGSKMDLEQRELAYTNASANYEAARLRYLDMKKQLEFAASQSRKQVAISQKNARDFTICSKIKGRVYSISKEVGEYVNAQMAVAIVGAPDDFLLELQIDESDIVRVKPGQRVFLNLDSYQNQVFEAAISKIDPIMNERSRTFTVEAIFLKKPPVLYPNLTAEANIVVLEKEKSLTIPRAFLVGDTAVMLENKQIRRVEIGLKDYQRVEVLRGLEPSEFIIKPGK